MNLTYYAVIFIIIIMLYFFMKNKNDVITIGFILEDSVVNKGLKESFIYGLQNNDNADKKVNVLYYNTDSSTNGMATNVNNFLQYIDQNNLNPEKCFIVAGYTTDELLTAHDIAPHILCGSCASTSPKIDEIPNTVTVGYSDEHSVTMFAGYCKMANIVDVIIVAPNNNTYAQTYIDYLQKSDMLQDYNIDNVLKYDVGNTANIFNDLSKYLTSRTCVFLIADEIDGSKICKYIEQYGNENNLLNGFDGLTVYATDLAENLKDEFGNLPVVVTIQYCLDYTKKTKSLYQKLIQNFGGNKISQLCAGVYDFGFKIGDYVKNNEIINQQTFCKIEQSIDSPAMFSFGWLDPNTGRSPWMSVGLILTKSNSDDITADRILSIGNAPTTMDSMSCFLWCEKVQWAMPNYFVFYENEITNYVDENGNNIAKMLNMESRTIIKNGHTYMIGFSPWINAYISRDGIIKNSKAKLEFPMKINTVTIS